MWARTFVTDFAAVALPGLTLEFKSEVNPLAPEEKPFLQQVTATLKMFDDFVFESESRLRQVIEDLKLRLEAQQ